MTAATNTKPATKRSHNTVGKSEHERDATRASAKSEGSDAIATLLDGADANADHTAASAPSKAKSKTALVLDLLRRPDGASIDQLVDATGWLPHTTRAALTGLKKNGYDLTNQKVEGGPRIYRVVKDPALPVGNSDGAVAEAAA